MVTNLPLSFGNPLAISIFLIVLTAAGQNHLSTVWRVCFGIGVIFPLSVFCEFTQVYVIPCLGADLLDQTSVSRC